MAGGRLVWAWVAFMSLGVACPTACIAREPLKFSGSLGITHRIIAYDDQSVTGPLGNAGRAFVNRSLSTQILRFSLSGPLLDERFIQFVGRGSLEGQRVAAEIPKDERSEYLGPKLTNYSLTATLFPLRRFVHWISIAGADFEAVQFEDKNRYLASGVRPFLSVVRRYTNKSNSFGAGGQYNLGRKNKLALRYENLNRSSVKVYDFAEDDDLSSDILERNLGTPMTPGNFIIAVSNGTQDSLNFFIDGDLIATVPPRAESRTEVPPGFHTLKAEVGTFNPLEVPIVATEDLVWRVRFEAVPPPLDRNIESESTSADLDMVVRNAKLGFDARYADGFDMTNMRKTYSSRAAFTAHMPLSSSVDLDHTTDYFTETSRIATPGGVFATKAFSSSADLNVRGVASSDVRLLYRFAKNTAGETSTDSHDVNLLAVRRWPWDVESRTAALLSSRTSVPYTIQLVRRFASTATASKTALGFNVRPGYTFTLDYNDLAPGTDTHILEHEVFMDLNATIGKKTFLTGRMQVDREGRKEFNRPSERTPNELAGERTKIDKRFSLSGTSRAISWVSLNWVLEKNRGRSSGVGRFAASDNDDLFLKGKGAFKEVKGIGITAEASFAKSLTVQIARYRLGHISNIKPIKGKLLASLDVETRMLTLTPYVQVKDRNTYAVTADFTFQIGKVLVRNEFEYRRVKDFRREADTDVTVFYVSVERTFGGSF